MQSSAHEARRRHKAAILIQTGFWMSQARWKTRSRLCRQIRCQGLDYAFLQQDLIPIEHFIKRIVFSPLANTVAVWLRRILLLCIREADSLCEDMQLLTTAEPRSAINRVLSAFLFALYRGNAIDRSLPVAEELYQSSLELCPAIEACMTTTPRTSLRDAGTRVARALRVFLNLHREWRQLNEQVILRRLAQGAIVRMHSIVSLRAPSEQLGVMGVLAMRSMATLGDGGLPTMRLIATTGEIGTIRKTIFDTSAFRMLNRMADSEFWGMHGLNTSRFEHELMIDQGFTLPMEQTIPALAKKFAPNRRSWSASELIFDAGTAIMWECRRADDIIDLADAMDVDAFPELLQDLPATVERICQVARRIVPEPLADAFHRRWESNRAAADADDCRSTLNRLLQCAIALRNTLANTRLDEIRQQQYYMHYRGVDYQRPISVGTRAWIQRAVLRCSPATIADLLAPGDPFALLKLHDHAIIDIVLGRGSADGYACGLTIGALPDILHFDYERMREAHRALRTCPLDEFGTRTNFDFLFRELVTSGKNPERRTLSRQVSEAAAILRAVVFVCRHKHGNALAKVAHEIARAMVARHSFR